MYSLASRSDRDPKHLRQLDVEGFSFDDDNHTPGEDAAQAGFTLVEVLVALALLATIGTMVFGSLVTTTRLVEAGREQATREQTVRRTLRLMADEFSLSRRIDAFPWVGMNGTQEGQPADTVAFLTMSDGLSRSTAKESDMIRVVYAREADRLVRFTRTNLYGLTDESLDEVELANQVKAFNLRYFDGQGQVWTDEWLANKMPKSLLIEITFQPSGAEPWTVREWVTIEAS
jgi:general secretion pathway protein J